MHADKRGYSMRCRYSPARQKGEWPRCINSMFICVHLRLKPFLGLVTGCMPPLCWPARGIHAVDFLAQILGAFGTAVQERGMRFLVIRPQGPGVVTIERQGGIPAKRVARNVETGGETL